MPNKIDRNSSSNDRMRRNWQRLSQLIASSTIGGGSSFVVDPNGALSTGGAGTGVRVDNVTIMIIGDELVAVGGTIAGTDTLPLWNEVPAGMVNGSTTAFTLAHTPSALALYADGRLMKPSGNDYALAGATVTFVSAPPSSTVLLADYQYVGISGEAIVYDEVPGGTVNGLNSTFTLAHLPITGSQEIYQNGLRLTPTGDYTISGSTITMIVPPPVQTVLLANYTWDATISTGTPIENEVPSGTKNGSNTSFLLTHPPIPPFIAVYRDGVRMSIPGDYSLTGSTIIFISPPAGSTLLLADYRY